MSVTDYAPPPTVLKFMLSDASFRLVMGPVGSGKSTGCCLEIARRARMQAPSRDGVRRTRWAIVRNTRQQLKDTTLKTWFEWFPDRVAGTWRETDQTFTLRFDDVVAEVMFRPLDNPEDVKRLLSLELTGAYVNEARELPLDVVVALRSRCGRYPSVKEVAPTWSGLIGDTNPPDDDHWIHTKFEQEKPRGWEIYKQPGGETPEAENVEHLPPSYYAEMKEGASPAWIDVHVHGKYGSSKAGKPVYESTFISGFHVSPTPLQPVFSAPLMLGMDFGRTPACTYEQRLPNGRVVVLDESFDDNTGLEGFLVRKVKPKLQARFQGMKVIVCGDPAGWDKSQINDMSCADVLAQQRFRAVRAPTNQLSRRLDAVERQLARQIEGKAGLLHDARCERLLRGYRAGYHYKATKTGLATTPDKNEFSHIHDGRQYAALCESFAPGMAGLDGGARPVEKVNSRGWT